MTETLFDDLEVFSREKRRQAIDHEVSLLLFGGCHNGLTLDAPEKAVLRAVRFHHGAEKAISIREITQVTGMEPRAVKNSVRALRCNFHLPIGSSKNAVSGGYFIILTKEDQAIFDGDFLGQIRAQVDAHRAVSGPHRTRELLGQLQMEID